MATTAVGNTGPSQALLDSLNGATGAKKSTAVEAQDRFMKLLVTQMKNQDPLNPLDNAQVTSQLAQLSTVTGIDKMNATMESMATSFTSDGAYKAAGMIGHGVMVPGDQASLESGAALMGFELAESADAVTLKVRDGAGNVVKTVALGAQGAGAVPVGWDGKNEAGVTMPDGKYKFEVLATKKGEKVAAELMSVAEVTSVSNGPSGIKLNLKGQNPVTMAEVRQII